LTGLTTIYKPASPKKLEGYIAKAGSKVGELAVVGIMTGCKQCASVGYFDMKVSANEWTGLNTRDECNICKVVSWPD